MDNTGSGSATTPRIKGRRSRFYVFSIVALTVFLVCAVIWPMRVQEFASSSAVQLKLDKQLAVDRQKLKSSLVAALNRMTADEEIEKAIQTVGRQTSIRSQYLTDTDRSVLRDRLAVRLLDSPSALEVRLAVEFKGDGTNDETKLVNHLTTKLVSEFSRETVRVTAVERQNDLKQQIAKIVNELNLDHRDSIDDLRKEMLSLEKQIEKAKDLCATESVQARTVRKDPDSNQPIIERIASLKRERQKLINEQNFNQFHPQITQIDQTIERLSGELKSFDQRSVQQDRELVNRSTLKNRFTVVSSQKETTTIDTSGFNRIHNQLNGINVADSLNKVDVIRGSFAFTNRQQELALAKIEALTNKIETDKAQVTLNDIKLARTSRPVGGVPTLGQVFLLLLSSLLMAAAVTAVFNPSLAFQPFSSTDQITEETGLPVIGTVEGQPETATKPPTPTTQKAVVGVVRICELFLIVCAIVLVVSAVIKTGFFASLMENPFHAAAKLFGG